MAFTAQLSCVPGDLRETEEAILGNLIAIRFIDKNMF